MCNKMVLQGKLRNFQEGGAFLAFLELPPPVNHLRGNQLLALSFESHAPILFWPLQALLFVIEFSENKELGRKCRLAQDFMTPDGEFYYTHIPPMLERHCPM